MAHTGPVWSLSRGRAARRVAAATATLLLVTGCTGGTDATDATDATVAATPSAIETFAPELAAYLEAVQATADASSLTVEAQVRVTTADGPATIDLRATAAGDRRTLEVTTAGGQVTYKVTPEGATVDTGTGPQPVELGEVPDVPGLGALGELEDLRVVSPGVVEGALASAVAAGAGDEGVGPVAVTVRYEPGGTVEEVHMVATSGGYEATVRFIDVVR